MGTPDQPEGIPVPLVWAGLEDVPIIYSNSFICQFDQDLQTFIVSFGQTTPPILIGTPDEIEQQAREIEFVQVKPVFRLALSQSRLQELVSVLGANLDQLEHVRTMRPGDPR